MRAAWRWAIAHGDEVAIAGALDALYLFYEVKGFFWQGAADFEQALGDWPPQALSRKINKALLTNRLLVRLGHFYLKLSRLDEAKERLQHSFHQLSHWSDMAANDVALTLNGLGGVALHQGDLREAQQKYREGLALFRKLGDRLHVAQTLTNLASVACQREAYEEARQLDGEALALFREVGNAWGTAVCLNNLSHLAEMAGDYRQAEQRLRESLAVARALSSHWLTAVALSNLSHLDLQHRPRQASRYAQDSLTLRRQHRLPGVKAVQKQLTNLEIRATSF